MSVHIRDFGHTSDGTPVKVAVLDNGIIEAHILSYAGALQKLIVKDRKGNPVDVVLGFDTTLTYEKLRIACDLVRAGRPVYGVNPDWNCPVEGGFIPDCGSIAALVKASTGVQCEFFGKPSPHTLQYMLRQTGCRPEELAVVGDRLYTDIAVTSGSEAMGILVMSGETTPEILAQSETKPDLVVQDLEELAGMLV